MKLTKNQKALLESLSQEEVREGDLIECNPSERRAALALYRKGLLNYISSQGVGNFFEVSLYHPKETA